MRAWLQETLALTKRWFLHTARQPIALAAGLFQPLIWLFLFGPLFQRMPGTLPQGADYLAFLSAGVIVFTAFNAALSSGVPVLFDKENKFLERLLTAPLVSRSSIVAASALHIFILSVLQTLLVLTVAALWSERLSLSPTVVAGTLVITGLLTFGFTALSLGLAFALRAHFEMLSLIQVVALPAVFVSTAFAPLEFMPGWLQWAASLNPLTLAITPVRQLLLTQTWSHDIVLHAPWASLGMAGCLAALVGWDAFVVAAVFVYLRRAFR